MTDVTQALSSGVISMVEWLYGCATHRGTI